MVVGSCVVEATNVGASWEVEIGAVGTGVEYPETLGEGVGAIPRISAIASAEACNIRFAFKFRERDLDEMRIVISKLSKYRICNFQATCYSRIPMLYRLYSLYRKLSRFQWNNRSRHLGRAIRTRF